MVREEESVADSTELNAWQKRHLPECSGLIYWVCILCIPPLTRTAGSLMSLADKS